MDKYNEINEIITSLGEISRIGICFYDLEDFFHFSSNGKREHIGHYCEFCRNVRLLENGRTMCENSDREEALQLAKLYKEPFFFKCHMGMCELIVPIVVDNTLRGIIFLGQCRLEDETNVEKIGTAAAKLKGNPEHFIELYNALPLVSRTKLISMGKIIWLYFHKLIEENVFVNTYQDTGGLSLAERIAFFIRQSYMKGITCRSIAEQFFINQSHMARIFRQAYGCTVTDYINRIRCENAERLLKSTTIPVNNIALNVGFSDANYFAKMYKRIYGCTPKEYRGR